VAGGLRVALEPNIVPYDIESGIEHWVLWYHPESKPGTEELDRQVCADHVKSFLPLSEFNAEQELCVFQNIPEFRSVPEMAHAHVFFRPQSAEVAAAVHQLRMERRIRSPWVETERRGGRGAEVGY
jgi:hypothetical protein